MAELKDNARLSDLTANAGTANRAGELIDAVYSLRPPFLLKACMMGHHDRLRASHPERDTIDKAPKLDLDEVAASAGLEAGDVIAAAVRSSNADLRTGVVVYVAEDDAGSAYKGAYLLADHDTGSKAKSHVSEAEVFGESEIAKRLRAGLAPGEDDPDPADAAGGEVKTTRRVRKPPAGNSGGS